jgi:hypothetical protein
MKVRRDWDIGFLLLDVLLPSRSNPEDRSQTIRGSNPDASSFQPFEASIAGISNGDCMPDFCDDSVLNYTASRRVFPPGEPLLFDEAYRLCHLPLVAPDHPKVIAETPGRDYRRGRYETDRYALVVPVAMADLTASPVFQAVDRAMRAAPFAGKVAWDLIERRADKLHATLLSGLDRPRAEECAEAASRFLARNGPLAFRLGGPLAGAKNLGRLYFPAYPQRLGGDDAFALLQEAVGARRSRFYAVGYYNLAQELDPAEAAALAAILDRWGPEPVAELAVGHLELHVTNDDLVLSGRRFIELDGATGALTRA